MMDKFAAFFAKGKDAIQMFPATGADVDAIASLPLNKHVLVEVTQARNLGFHKKFFALLKVTYNMMHDEDRKSCNIWSVAELLVRLKIDLGLYELWIAAAGAHVPEGTPIFIPKSISFAKMDEVAFERLYKEAIGVIIGRYLRHHDDVTLMQMVDRVLRFE